VPIIYAACADLGVTFCPHGRTSHGRRVDIAKPEGRRHPLAQVRKALALGEIGPVVGAAAPVRAVIPPARSNATARQKAASPPFPRKRAKCDPSVMQML
jgi:hypothetical protein